MEPKPRLNQNINATIQRLGIYGEGVGYWHGYTVFIDGALPGEVVHARLIEKEKRWGRGKIVEIENPSPARVQPPCQLFGKCGGCQLMHVDYAAQLDMKRERVVDAFERIGKLGEVGVLPCVPSPTPLAYRNKIQVPVRRGEDGIRIGFNARNTHDLVEVDFCHIHCPLGQKVYEEVCRVIKGSKICPYDSVTGKGELRYLIIKSAVSTGSALLILVTSGKASDELIQAAEKLMASVPEIKGIVQNINSSPNNVVFGGEFFNLAGRGYIEEEILGLRFKVSPASFFQVNPRQAENLYRKVIEYSALEGSEMVLDLYCGVGTISLLLSERAKQVIGVECVAGAIEDAKMNADMNKINNTLFVCAEAEAYIQNLESADVVILNPPRKGCEPSLLDKLHTVMPKKIVYVSCDPATLARDLAKIKGFGYRIVQAVPFDMFPQTAHVETAVLLLREI